jgi:acyl dehydratase
MATLTGSANYFEDFTAGDVYRHARGKTVGEMENHLITHLVMNTAEGHFNADAMQGNMFGQRVVFGGVTIATVIGLTRQDTAENALAELGLDKIRLKAPVFHGDTLYAYSEVLETVDAERPDAGEVRFRHWGINQDDKIVFEGERRVLIKRRDGAAGA